MAAWRREEYAAARAALAESLTEARAMGNRWIAAASLECLGHVALEQEETTAAGALFAESLAVYRALGDRFGTANSLQGRGLVAHAQGDTPLARALLTESLVLLREPASVPFLAATLDGLAGAAAASSTGGAPERWASRSLRLAGAASAIREAHGPSPTRRERERLARWLAPARRALTEDAAAAAWAEGRAMTPGEAVAYGMSDESA
jgi:hypothetical protein